jgi:hypothetical protein
MSTPWDLFNQAQSKNNSNKFSIYRCIDPVALETTNPWYPITNVCPCDPMLSNKSGRGFTACPMGLMTEQINQVYPASQLLNQIPEKNKVVGNMYNENQFVPPQLNPRPLAEIGNQWRSSN